MLFGEFSVADAYFAPVCMRLITYTLPMPKNIADYVAKVTSLPSANAWLRAALLQKDFVVKDEPYRVKSS